MYTSNRVYFISIDPIHITLDTYADVFSRLNLGAIEKYEKLMDEVMPSEDKDKEQTYTDNIVYMPSSKMAKVKDAAMQYM